MSDINAERTVFRVRCPVCSGTHLFPDAGVDLDANPLLARRLCVDLHERWKVIEAGGSLGEALGLDED